MIPGAGADAVGNWNGKSVAVVVGVVLVVSTVSAVFLIDDVNELKSNVLLVEVVLVEVEVEVVLVEVVVLVLDVVLVVDDNEIPPLLPGLLAQTLFPSLTTQYGVDPLQHRSFPGHSELVAL